MMKGSRSCTGTDADKNAGPQRAAARLILALDALVRLPAEGAPRAPGSRIGHARASWPSRNASE